MLERFLADLRIGVRLLRRNPGFAAVAILVLALGIGANTASFGLLDALLFKPLPVRSPDRLVRVTGSGTDGGVSYADYLDYRANAPSLSGLAVFTADTLAYRRDGSGEGDLVSAYLVSDDYFEVLQADLALGRSLRGEEAARSVVLSDAFWRRRLGADPGVLGRSLWLNRGSFVVVGVAAQDFSGTMRGGRPDLFIPLTSQFPPEELLLRGRRGLIAVGRLAPLAALGAAQAQLTLVSRRLAAAYPQTNAGVIVTVGPERTALFRELPQLYYIVVVLFLMFGLLLTIACANIAGLLLARATFREKEIAVRAMLGATRRALVSQLLAESIVLASLGGAGGLIVGVVARGLLWKRLETAVADHLGLTVLWIDAGVDARLALFTFAAAAVSVLLFGLVPALHAAKHDLYGGAKHEPSSPSPGHLARLRHLVVGQVALSAVLLALSALLMRAVESGTSADLGHPVDRLYLASLNLAGVEKGRTQPAFARVLEHVRGLAGVEGAALGGGGWPDYLPTSANPGRPRQNYVLGMAGPAHFATLAIPILSGREFDERDTQESPPVAILNQRLSEALWPGQDPVGRRLVVWEDKPALTVVGLVKTVRTFPLGPPFFQLYVPFSQHDLVAATLSVRIQPGQEDLVRTRLVGELRGLRLGLTCVRVRSLAEAVGSVLAVPRALVAELAALGAVALFLAAVGLYGLTAYVAGRRTQECAVRSMLGASRLAILRLLVGGTMRMVGIGLGLGLATSLILGWLLKDALLGAAFDPLAFAVPPLVLSVAAVVAVGLPTFRAASVDPMMALRNE